MENGVYFLFPVLSGDRLSLFIFAPFVAALFIRNGEYLTNWLKNTCAVVFTQAFHALFLLIAMKILLHEGMGLNEFFSNDEISAALIVTKFFTFIGTIVVAIRGPRILKEFLYSSGAGTGFMGIVGTGGRFILYRTMRNTLRKTVTRR